MKGNEWVVAFAVAAILIVFVFSSFLQNGVVQRSGQRTATPVTEVSGQ